MGSIKYLLFNIINKYYGDRTDLIESGRSPFQILQVEKDSGRCSS